MKLLILAILTFILAEVIPIVNEILTYATPLIVLGVSYLVGKIKPLIPGWAMLLVVSGLATAVTFIVQLTSSPDLTFLQQLLYGMIAVVIQQFYKQFSEDKRTKDAQKILESKKLL